jgi:hypothetical protein
MILEGIPSFFLGIVTIFFLADNPSQATYLTPSEREFLRLRRLREQGETANGQKFHWEDVRKTFLDWRVIAFAIAQFGVDTMVTIFPLFLLLLLTNRFGSLPYCGYSSMGLVFFCLLLFNILDIGVLLSPKWRVVPGIPRSI